MDPLARTLLRDSDLQLWIKKSGITPSIATPIKAADTEKSVFLTGSSGFLGRFILQALLNDPRCGQVYCHIRPTSSKSGKDRLFSILSSSFPGDPDTLQSWFKNKIRIVEGDLSKPLIGLDQETFQHLAHSVDAIIHNGNTINFFKSYEEMRIANVDSTKAMIQLAMTGRNKFLNYVSTFGVMMPLELWSDECSSLPTAEKIVLYFIVALNSRKAALTGFGCHYNHSKWASDRLMGQAISSGYINGALSRPSLVGPHSVSGEANERDFLTILLGGMIELEAIPYFKDSVFYLTPADYVTAAIAAVSLRGNTAEDLMPGANYPAYNLAYSDNRVAFSTLMSSLKRLMPRVQTMDYASFKKLTADRKPTGSVFLSRMHSVLASIPSSEEFGISYLSGIGPEHVISDLHTRKILQKNYNIHSPPYSSSSISTFLRKIISAVKMAPK